MSQGEFAEAVGGCTSAFISMIERGKSAPSAGVVAGVERLGYSSGYLMSGTGDKLRATDPSNPTDPASVRDAPSSSPLRPTITLVLPPDVQAGDTILVRIDRRDHPLALIGKIIYTLPRK